jgi:hypothetical protein
VSIGLDTATATGFTRASSLGDLYSADVTSAFGAGLYGPHTLTVTAPGDLELLGHPAGDPSALDETKVLDILLYVQVKLPAAP